MAFSLGQIRMLGSIFFVTFMRCFRSSLLRVARFCYLMRHHEPSKNVPIMQPQSFLNRQHTSIIPSSPYKCIIHGISSHYFDLASFSLNFRTAQTLLLALIFSKRYKIFGFPQNGKMAWHCFRTAQTQTKIYLVSKKNNE